SAGAVLPLPPWEAGQVAHVSRKDCHGKAGSGRTQGRPPSSARVLHPPGSIRGRECVARRHQSADFPGASLVSVAAAGLGAGHSLPRRTSFRAAETSRRETPADRPRTADKQEGAKQTPISCQVSTVGGGRT